MDPDPESKIIKISRSFIGRNLRPGSDQETLEGISASLNLDIG